MFPSLYLAFTVEPFIIPPLIGQIVSLSSDAMDTVTNRNADKIFDISFDIFVPLLINLSVLSV